MRLFSNILLLTILMASCALAGDYNLVDQFRVPPPEGAVMADPVVNPKGELAGFVYVSSDNQTVLIDDFTKGPELATSAGETVLKTINQYIGDTLYIYVLLSVASVPGMDYYYPKLYLMKSVKGVGIVQGREVPITLNHPGGGFFAPRTISHADISFNYTNSDQLPHVIFSCREVYFEYLETMGAVYQAVSTGIIFDYELASTLYRDSSTYLVRGRLCGSVEPDICGTTADYYAWDFRDSPDDTNRGSRSSVTVTAVTGNGNELATQTSQVYNPVKLFAGNFFQDSDNCDEVISTGYARDLLGLHGITARNHMACYSFKNGNPSELWYRDIAPNFIYYFSTGNFLIEIRNGIQVAHMNATDGQFTDVFSVPVAGYTRFFTTGPNNGTLNLLTLLNDTLKLYRYDTPTPVEEPGTSPSLPNSFSLDQNYPNPFNGQTVIKFELASPDEISVRVFNVRGQEVALLADGPHSKGSHRVTWKPDSKVASGVYFVTLESRTGSQTIRAQYVK